MECTKCKLQYVGKAQTKLNLRIINHRKDVMKLNAIPRSTFTKRTRFQHWLKVHNHWKTPKHEAKQRKHHRITQKAWKRLDKKTRNSPSERLNHELNWQISSNAFFSVHLDFIPKCISLSQVSEIESSQRCI